MHKKTELTLLLLVAIVVPLLGCAARAPVLEQEAYAPPPEPQRSIEPEVAVFKAEDRAQWPSGEAGMPDVTAVERKVIYTVSLELIVKDTEEAFHEVQRLTEEMGGFVSESNRWRDEGHPRASMTVRVPVDKLTDALAQFRALAVDVERESVDSQDVTEDYVDLEARLKTQQRTEAELLELLESRSETGKTEDILEVHRELSVIRQQIEQIQGRIRYLENLSAMATVQITLTPDALLQPVIVGGWRPQGTARNAIRMLLRTLQLFADFTIVFFLLILPILVVIAIPIVILFLIGRAIWRWIKRRRRKARQTG